MRSARILISALLAAAPFVVAATDAPHDKSYPGTPVDCDSCHMGHNATGSALTNNALGIVALCGTCHTAGKGHGFPFTDPTQATPGTGGKHHRWDAVATNRGATAPNPGSADHDIAALGKRLDLSQGAPGKLTCSVCHDQHNNWGRTGGTQNVSVALNTAIARTSGNGGGTLKLTNVPSNAKAAGYVIKITAANAFKISHDNGISYLGYSTSNANWAADSTAGYGSGRTFTSGMAVPLDDGLTEVTFTTPFDTTTPDVFANFFVTYPFLRISNVDSAMCIVCHADRNMTHVTVAGPTDGNTVFSHPVGESLNANLKGYDRGDGATNNVLDANGALQTTGDGIASNDLKLGASNSVHCMTCHSPHNADSNSLTEMP